VLFISSFIICSCQKAKEQEAKSVDTEPAQENAPPLVVVTTVEKANVPIYKEWVGQTAASQTVNIRARVEGNLESANFKEGDYVDKGQILFQIEKDSYEASLQSAKADLEKAKAALNQAQHQVQVSEQNELLAKYESALTRATRDLTRIKALAQQGAISQKELDSAVDAQRQAQAQVESQKATLSDTGLNKESSIQTQLANVESAKAALKQAQLNLSYTTIRSPLHGIIGRIQVYPGNLVSITDNSVLATISSVDPIKVDFNVSEAEYLKFAKKNADTKAKDEGPLELYLADNALYPFKGTFHWVDRAVDSKTGTMAVEALFPNSKAIVRPGQFAKVKGLVATVKDALLIPNKCVQDLQGSKTVYLVDSDNKVVLKTISLGSDFKDKVIVESGLSAGDKIILEGLQKARPGKKVMLASDMKE
ncbi:MAG: efflux RND transporter periplasmic adaptor subunit, partial [Candidatus Obscuribacterales bacterium]|nr:efflux RND transporter periplasmic adaptor subunit [Candidatus Obscuribacterales bacterium]